MVRFRCPSCDKNWFPYQTQKGACPECGGGTVRNLDEVQQCKEQERISVKSKKQIYEEFELYYAEREARKLQEEIENIEVA